MIKVLLAKSAIENEEGMNHMWIQLASARVVKHARLQLLLPTGIYRLRNLNGYYEEQTGEILIVNPEMENDVVIEIFTREPIPSGEKTISVALCYNDENGRFTRIEHFIPLDVVPEEKMDKVVIDDVVVNKIKELQQHNENSAENEFMDYSQTKIIRIDSSQISKWEKKYRIEGIIQ
ncbi:hypothetical protein SY83_17270 [Paenibacillus swuensis]|uniref:Uncharacterized protein n=1 Tax=Paenibacillus swuensis TaxID=1178515 RepID=A0A172TLT4_9BACL|nr:hypothetical protein [Paenibacillus swuensis]ANE47743.1 hypothetical protein SY83_17270 [Paenibacillus swuensis]